MGAYVSLLEYDNIEGMILLSELSRRRIRSINKLIRVGKQEVRARVPLPTLLWGNTMAPSRPHILGLGAAPFPPLASGQVARLCTRAHTRAACQPAAAQAL